MKLSVCANISRGKPELPLPETAVRAQVKLRSRPRLISRTFPSRAMLPICCDAKPKRHHRRHHPSQSRCRLLLFPRRLLQRLSRRRLQHRHFQLLNRLRGALSSLSLRSVLRLQFRRLRRLLLGLYRLNPRSLKSPLSASLRRASQLRRLRDAAQLRRARPLFNHTPQHRFKLRNLRLRRRLHRPQRRLRMPRSSSARKLLRRHSVA